MLYYKEGKMCQSLNERVKKMTVVDIGMVKLSVFFFTIIIVKLIPGLLNISHPVLTILVIASAALPLYDLWIKK